MDNGELRRGQRPFSPEVDSKLVKGFHLLGSS